MIESELQAIAYRYSEGVTGEDVLLLLHDVNRLLEEVKRLEADRERWRAVIRDVMEVYPNIPCLSIITKEKFWRLELLLGEK